MTGSGAVDPDLCARVREWIADDPDPATAAEAAELLARATGSPPAASGGADDEARGRSAAELADRFAGLLTFGTAGLRGALGAGPNRMNRAVVIRAAAALSGYLTDALAGQGAPRVVIGFDARHGSAQFAEDTAAVVTAAGGAALLLPAAGPTPVLAFAVRHLDADAGVMVTASHNPASDNGYKVYLGGRVVRDEGEGAQLVPPADADIAARMAAVTRTRAVPRVEGGWAVLDDAVATAYLDRLGETIPRGRRDVRIVLTPLHGVGGALARRALALAGFADVHLVAEQATPDPDFPTTGSPNPEEPGALDLALATASTLAADLVLALDPDADRCAVAVPDGRSGWRVLTGDEVGAVLGQQAARSVTEPRGPMSSPRTVLASSIVSSRLLSRIASAHALPHVTTPTGFKWIARVPHLLFGYEEALGYCVDPDAVRDKDGIAAATRVAVLVDELASQGRSLLTVLDDLAREHGLHMTSQVAVRRENVSAIPELLGRLRAAPPDHLGGSPVVDAIDLAGGSAALPPIEGLVYATSAGDRVVVRPSGTEPKVKCYLEVIVGVGDGDLHRARARAEARIAALRADVSALLQG